MSEVYEVEPTRCPSCGASWSEPGSMLRSWDAATGHGHRTWTCQACRHVEHPERVGLRPVRPGK